MKTMSMITTSLILLTASADADDHGEKLNYTVHVMKSDFAKATLYSSGDKIYGEIKTNEKWKSIFPMDNKIASRLDSSSFPIETELSFCQRKKLSLYDIKFMEGAIRVVKSKNGRETRKTRKTNSKAHDLASWLYYVREIVKKEPDTLASFKVFSGNKTYDVNLVPLPEEILKTPLGEKVAKPYKVVVTRPVRYKKEMKIWFESSGTHTPLRITGKAKLGSFEIMISSIEEKVESKNVQLQ